MNKFVEIIEIPAKTERVFSYSKAEGGFAGGYFSKWLENKNAKKIELYKIQTSLSLKIIDLASAYLHNSEDSALKSALICESCKVKLYFPDNVLKALNNLILDDKESKYGILMEELRKNIK